MIGKVRGRVNCPYAPSGSRARESRPEAHRFPAPRAALHRADGDLPALRRKSGLRPGRNIR
jgi:hypothetical protein